MVRKKIWLLSMRSRNANDKIKAITILWTPNILVDFFLLLPPEHSIYTQYSRDENTTFFLQTTLTEMESLLWPSFNLTSSLIAIMELYYTLFSSVALSLSFPCSEFRFCQFTTENGSMNLRWKVPLVIFDKKFLVSSHTFVRWFCVLGVCV